jgi:hypothetical protein
MVKTCLTATAKIGVFKKNSQDPHKFELTPVSPSNFPFLYFRLSLPYSDHLIAQRAVYVVESVKDGIKVLNTGLRKTQVSTIYYGDMYNQLTKVCSLLLFCVSGGGEICTVYLFEGYYPKSLKKVLNEIIKL